MKTALSLLVFINVFIIYAYAQRQQVDFKVSIPESSNRSIFDKNPDLAYVMVHYKNDEAGSISIYSNARKEGKYMETFYTSFAGDCYLLSKRYPDLILPRAPKLDVWNFNNIKKLRDSTVVVKVLTTIKRDTLVHSFSYYIIQKGMYEFDRLEWNSPIVKSYMLKDSVTHRDTAYSLHPRLKGNLLQYEKKLTHSYKQWKPIAIADSTLIFTGIVEKNGSFGNIQLAMGRASAFSEKVSQFILKEARSWWPVVMGMVTKIRYPTKIFVRLNQDDSITFSTL